MKMNTEDILGYLTMTDASEHQKIISQLDENVVYDIYETNRYGNLGEFMHYFMYEVLVNNMKYHHFGGGVTHALVYHRLTDDDENMRVGDANVGTSYIPMTSKKDMRKCGEEQFKKFILTYGKSLFEGIVHKNRDLYSVRNQYHIDNLVYFLVYAVENNMGMLSHEGYGEVKEGLMRILENSQKGMTQQERERYLKRWGTLTLVVDRSFRLAEEQYLGHSYTGG